MSLEFVDGLRVHTLLVTTQIVRSELDKPNCQLFRS